MSFKKLGELTVDETPVVNSNNLITSGAVANLSNPNLLINGDFKINQRMSSTYNTVNKYTVDRWELTGGASEVIVNNDGTITLNVLNSNTTARILQYIENTQSLLGKTVTFTIKTNNATYSTTATLPATLPNANADYGDKSTGNIGRLRISYISSLQMFCFKIEAFAGGTYDNTITLEYAKVEIGSVATPFSPRPYAEELALCQRYFLKLSGTAATHPFATTFAYSATNVGAILFHKLRTGPTLSYPNTGLQYRAGSGTQVVTTISIDGFTTQCVNLRMAVTDATQGESGLLRTRASGDYISLDAEIY